MHLVAKDKRGFSLFELLTVMAIMGLLAAVTVPAFNSIASGQRVAQGAYEISALLEFARSEAVARQTYVWVGAVNTNVSGRYELRMAAVCSRDGSSDASSGNLVNLIKVRSVQNLALSNWNALKPETKGRLPSMADAPSSVSTNSQGISFTVGKTQFNGNTITFTPRGEAMLVGSPGPYDGYAPCIDLSFQESHGGIVAPGASDAAVVVDGATGSPLVVQIP